MKKKKHVNKKKDTLIIMRRLVNRILLNRIVYFRLDQIN